MNSPRGEKLVSATELIRESLSMLYVARWKIITISAPLFLLSLASTVFDRDITELAREIISYGILIVGIITQLSLVSLAIAYHRGEEELPMESFFRAMGLVSSYLAIFVLLFFSTFGGYIAFILPGIYLSLALAFAVYVLFEEGKHGYNALTRSLFLVNGRWLEVFLQVVAFGIFSSFVSLSTLLLPLFFIIFGLESSLTFYLFGVLTIGVSSFFLQPLSAFYLYGVYRELVKLSGEASDIEIISLEKRLKLLIYIGVLASISAVVAMLIGKFS
ncbi:MAG: hypothetical protein AAB682_00685 [Patescibacteria group bacterium]